MTAPDAHLGTRRNAEVKSASWRADAAPRRPRRRRVHYHSYVDDASGTEGGNRKATLATARARHQGRGEVPRRRRAATSRSTNTLVALLRAGLDYVTYLMYKGNGVFIMLGIGCDYP